MLIGAIALLAVAADRPVPWAITGTSSVSEAPILSLGHRVEGRMFRKSGRVITRAGFGWLSRGDLRSNPGITADLTWYPIETIGIDLLSSTFFFSTLTATADALRRSTGLLPDSQKPIARLMPGARWAFAYGKLLIEDADAVVHVDAALCGHLGVLVTDRAPNPAVDLGFALQAGLQHAVVFLEASWLLSYEDRTTSSLASGPQASAGLGISW
jgi:hypothetical protein